MLSRDSIFTYLIISVALHTAVALIYQVYKKETQVFMSAPIDVAFYAPSEKRADPPPVVPVEENLPEPVKEENKEEPKTPDDIVVKEKEKPKPKPKQKPKPKPQPKPEPKKEEHPEIELPPGYNEVQTLQPSALAEPKYAAVGAQYNELAFDTANFKYAYYTNTIIRNISRVWQWAESYGRLRAVVYFKILKDGSVMSVAVKESSGDDSYDQNAVRAIQRAAPFAPLPEGYAGDSLGVYFEFKFRN